MTQDYLNALPAAFIIKVGLVLRAFTVAGGNDSPLSDASALSNNTAFSAAQENLFANL
jgi:hypothetical protein